MRRDVCYFFAADVKSVYDAYLAAATNAKFRRTCNQQPYHTISFNLNFSMKYNMNGGSCTLHFIPYQGGTAVDLRFSIAQLAGARYKKYAEDLTNATVDVLRIPAQPITLDINVFLDERNKIHADNTPKTFTKTPVPPVSMQTKVCKNCGVFPWQFFQYGAGIPLLS